MKKIISICLIVCSLFMITGCNKDDNKNKDLTDGAKFKEEYEKLNGIIREKDGKKIRSINIAEDNPMKYKSADEILDMVNNKESFIVYFGFNDCPWCRSVVPYMIEEAKNKNIDTIYYVDVKDIRDTLELDDNNEVKTSKEGSKAYMELIDIFSKVLDDYTLKNASGKTIKTGEKRIFAPNIVVVNKGVAVKKEDGISDLQTDGYMELSDEIINDIRTKVNCSFSCLEKETTCNDKC